MSYTLLPTVNKGGHINATSFLFLCCCCSCSCCFCCLLELMVHARSMWCYWRCCRPLEYTAWLQGDLKIAEELYTSDDWWKWSVRKWWHADLKQSVSPIGLTWTTDQTRRHFPQQTMAHQALWPVNKQIMRKIGGVLCYTQHLHSCLTVSLLTHRDTLDSPWHVATMHTLTVTRCCNAHTHHDTLLQCTHSPWHVATMHTLTVTLLTLRDTLLQCTHSPWHSWLTVTHCYNAHTHRDTLLQCSHTYRDTLDSPWRVATMHTLTVTRCYNAHTYRDTLLQCTHTHSPWHSWLTLTRCYNAHTHRDTLLQCTHLPWHVAAMHTLTVTLLTHRDPLLQCTHLPWHIATLQGCAIQSFEMCNT